MSESMSDERLSEQHLLKEGERFRAETGDRSIASIYIRVVPAAKHVSLLDGVHDLAPDAKKRTAAHQPLYCAESIHGRLHSTMNL
jgi:hypothetical protein